MNSQAEVWHIIGIYGVCFEADRFTLSLDADVIAAGRIDSTSIIYDGSSVLLSAVTAFEVLRLWRQLHADAAQ